MFGSIFEGIGKERNSGHCVFSGNLPLCLEGPTGKGRQWTTTIKAQQLLIELTSKAQCAHPIDERCQSATPPAYPFHVGNEAVGQGCAVLLMDLVEHFTFEPCHVNTGGAFALARLAFETEVKHR